MSNYKKETHVWTLNHDVPIKQFLRYFMKTLTKQKRSLLRENIKKYIFKIKTFPFLSVELTFHLSLRDKAGWRYVTGNREQ